MVLKAIFSDFNFLNQRGYLYNVKQQKMMYKGLKIEFSNFSPFHGLASVYNLLVVNYEALEI